MKTGALKFLLIFIYETEHWNGLNNCLENNSVQKLVKKKSMKCKRPGSLVTIV